MNKKEYAEALLNPKWQEKRSRILRRDLYTCVVCQTKSRTLHVHHLEYKDGKRPWEYPDDMLVTLCDRCHATNHKKRNPKLVKNDAKKSDMVKILNGIMATCGWKRFVDLKADLLELQKKYQKIE